MTSVLALALVILVAAATPSAAQEEQFPASDPDRPLLGSTRSDGTIVLDDTSYCRYLLTAALGDERLTRVALLDRSKKQKKARNGAFAPGSDEAVLARCEDALAAFRAEAVEGDTLPGWARRAPVVPETIAALLPEDFEAVPLAQPDEVGPAARTSGFGDVVSAPFSVTPGPWLAELDATGCADWSGTLRDARDPERSFPLADSREYLYELGGGHYYWDVTASDCAWSVDLVPVVLGPDPTPTPEPRIPVPSLHGERWDRNAPNPEFKTVTEARQALLDAGLVAGEYIEEPFEAVIAGRVWAQDPPAGTLLEANSPVSVRAVSDCDVFLGDRIILE